MALLRRQPRRQAAIKPKRDARSPRPTSVGTRVAFELGGSTVVGVVIEDRGPLGHEGNRLLRVRVDIDEFEPFEAEVYEAWCRPVERKGGTSMVSKNQRRWYIDVGDDGGDKSVVSLDMGTAPKHIEGYMAKLIQRRYDEEERLDDLSVAVEVLVEDVAPADGCYEVTDADGYHRSWCKGLEAARAMATEAHGAVWAHLSVLGTAKTEVQVFVEEPDWLFDRKP